VTLVLLSCRYVSLVIPVRWMSPASARASHAPIDGVVAELDQLAPKFTRVDVHSPRILMSNSNVRSTDTVRNSTSKNPTNPSRFPSRFLVRPTAVLLQWTESRFRGDEFGIASEI
jgi:hypothetical protein